MAAKGVNLLDDDDDSEDASLSDFDDDLDSELGSSSGSSGGKSGGGLIRKIVIALVVLVVLGGGSWAGYQFWWVPRQIQAQKKIEAQKRLEELKKQRREQAKTERARRKKELALLQKMQADKKEEVKQSAQQEPEIKEPEPPKAVAAVEIRKPEKAKKEPASLPKTRSKAVKKPAVVAIPEKKVEAPEPRREPTPRRMARASSVPKPKAAVTRKKRPLVKSIIARAPKRLAKVTPGSYFSIQVATCRTDKCIKSFVRNLRAKGFKPFVSGGSRVSPLAQTEVLLGDFASKSAAATMASKARGKRVRTTVYKSGSKWVVSAGRFTDLEDAAQRLDQVEDSGFVGRLSASRAVAKKSNLRTVRIGRMAKRQDAVAMLARINRSGFSGSYVVRRK